MRDAAAAEVGAEELSADPFFHVRPGLDAVDAFIERQLVADGMQLEAVARHLMAGGKRLRPALVLLTGGLCGGASESLVPVAAACELIHMATLIHDDMIDEAGLRRGVPSVHARWGVPTSVLAGDHLFAKGFSVLAAHGDPLVVRLMSDVVSRTCAGEIEELQAQWDIDATEDAYLRRVYAKTGFFIAECCRMGAVVARAPGGLEEAVALYGSEIGTCFQVVDDLLDLTASERTLGKPTGSDLRTGVYTLPILRALQGAHGPELRALLQRRPVDDATVRSVREVLRRSGALETTASTALAMARRAQAALEPLPESGERRLLLHLAEELSHRVS